VKFTQEVAKIVDEIEASRTMQEVNVVIKNESGAEAAKPAVRASFSKVSKVGYLESISRIRKVTSTERD
jgi:hypothetical protein